MPLFDYFDPLNGSNPNILVYRVGGKFAGTVVVKHEMWVAQERLRRK